MSEQAGLSILIPIFNYDVTDLVNDLSNQALGIKIPYEIICFDDCSTADLAKKNKAIKDLPNVIYKVFEKNIGRAAIRNELSKSSSFKFILFIDADSTIINNNYLKQYWDLRDDKTVIGGGTIYSNNFNTNFSLRYKYGKCREEKNAKTRNKNPYAFIYLNNLFLPKSIFQKIQLDNKIITYGHEDTKFGFALKNLNVPVIHIQNAVEHTGLETNSVFINKTKEGIKNLYNIIQEGTILESKLYIAFIYIKKLKLIPFFNFLYNFLSNRIEKNLFSNKPSLLYFDLFKLNLLIQEDTKDSKINK